MGTRWLSFAVFTNFPKKIRELPWLKKSPKMPCNHISQLAVILLVTVSTFILGLTAT